MEFQHVKRLWSQPDNKCHILSHLQGLVFPAEILREWKPYALVSFCHQFNLEQEKTSINNIVEMGHFHKPKQESPHHGHSRLEVHQVLNAVSTSPAQFTQKELTLSFYFKLRVLKILFTLVSQIRMLKVAETPYISLLSKSTVTISQ